jgi:hypothetical protein
MATTRQIKLRVPTDVDTMQDNYKGLILHEINKTRAEWQGQISGVFNGLSSGTGAADIGAVIEAKMNAAEADLISKIDTEIEGNFVTQSKNYIEDKVLEFEQHVTEKLSTKADKKTVDALDEFFKVVDSAMVFTDPSTNIDTGYAGVRVPDL